MYLKMYDHTMRHNQTQAKQQQRTTSRAYMVSVLSEFFRIIRAIASINRSARMNSVPRIAWSVG